MPQSDKSHLSYTPSPSSSPYSSFEGHVFEITSPEKLKEALTLAIDYRGDVTLDLKDGTSLEGFIYRVDESANKNGSHSENQPSVVYLFAKTGAKTSDSITVDAHAIKAIRFTGEDTAFGKSWEEWTKKSQAQKQKEAEAQKRQSEELGHL